MGAFYFFILILSLSATAWFANRQARRDRFPIVWHLLMGGVALAHVLVTSFRVMGLGESIGVSGISMLWFLVWLILLFVLRKQGKRRDAQILLSIPLAYLVVSFLSQLITGRQIEAAELAGDGVAVRIESYRDAEGELPESLLTLSNFDGLQIPEIKVGFWGPQGLRYSRYEEVGYSLYFDAFMGVQRFRGDNGDWFGED